MCVVNQAIAALHAALRAPSGASYPSKTGADKGPEDRSGCPGQDDRLSGIYSHKLQLGTSRLVGDEFACSISN